MKAQQIDDAVLLGWGPTVNVKLQMVIAPASQQAQAADWRGIGRWIDRRPFANQRCG
jgi:hypothetical protein